MKQQTSRVSVASPDAAERPDPGRRRCLGHGARRGVLACALGLLAACGSAPISNSSQAGAAGQTLSPVMTDASKPGVSPPVAGMTPKPAAAGAVAAQSASGGSGGIAGNAAASAPPVSSKPEMPPAAGMPAAGAAAAPAPAVDEIPTCEKSTLMPGNSSGTVMVGGMQRNYLLHVPPMYDGKTPMPLILDFPALTQSASGQRGASGNAALADQEGIVVAYPDGIGGAFNICPTDNPKTNCRCCTGSRDVDDLGFSLELVKKLKREGCIDPKRVYATGYSMGGGMDYFLACYAADVFAAVAASSFDMVVMEQIPCKPSRPITVVSSRGTADGVVEYGGSVSSFGMMFQGAVGSWNMWKEINGCTGEPEDTGMGCQSYKSCGAPGVEATLCTAQGGGHSPGNAALLWSHIKDARLP